MLLELLQSPSVVALETAMYSSPVLPDSNLLSPGSTTTRSTALGCWPWFTGPADCPWKVWQVLANDRARGQYTALQHLFPHSLVTIGTGTTCVVDCSGGWNAKVSETRFKIEQSNNVFL